MSSIQLLSLLGIAVGVIFLLDALFGTTDTARRGAEIAASLASFVLPYIVGKSRYREDSASRGGRRRRIELFPGVDSGQPEEETTESQGWRSLR